MIIIIISPSDVIGRLLLHSIGINVEVGPPSAAAVVKAL